MNKILTACLFLLLSVANCQLSLAQDTSICFMRDVNGRIREHNVDFIKMALDVKFDVASGKVIGKVAYDFKPIQPDIDTLFLNAPGISINKVLLNSTEVKYTTDTLGVTIRFSQPMNWNKQYKLEISYDAYPRKGLYFIGWNVEDNMPGSNDTFYVKKKDKYYTRKQIWTQGQGIDNRHWIPCYDDVNDKMLVETTITFDTAYTVISNGILKEKKLNTDKTYTWRYQMNKPMVPYLIMIGIDKFAYKDYKSKNGMTSRQYYYADRPETVVPTYQYSAEMMDWLVEQTGVAYPWQTYANIPVQDFMYGAMENTTATVYGDFYLCDARTSIERPYIATNAHELTHQWFGDYVTEYSATHHWLHESFATYYAKQFIHHVFGEDRYEADKRGEHNTAMYADKIDRYPVAHSKGGSNRHYPKGSAVIDMLRYVVGDSVFNKSVANYLKKHAYSNVLSEDFKMTFMETAGINLDWFFEEWIYRAGYPKFEVKYERVEDKVIFYVRQTQKTDELTGYFKMPVVFELHYKDGSKSSERVWLSHEADTVYIKAASGKEIDFALFDPASNIIKSVDFKKSFDELSAQAIKAPHMIDRFDAVRALRDTALEMKRDLLLLLFSKGNYNSIQFEILQQLADDTTTAAINVFAAALEDKDFYVRRSALENLDSVSASLLPKAEKLLTDTSYYNIENALRKLCRLYPANTKRYLADTKGVMGINNNVAIARLEIEIMQTSEDDSNYPELTRQLSEYASNRYEFRTRVRAIEALERLEYFDEYIAANLFNAITNPNGRLSGPALRAVKAFIKKPGNFQLAVGLLNSVTWKDWEKKVLDGVVKQ